MKRLVLGVLFVLSLVAPAAADEPKEIPLTGNPAVDVAVATVNAMNRAMKKIEDDADLVTKATDYYRQLMEMEQRLQKERRTIRELDKQLATQEGDLLSNLRSQKVGKTEAEIAALEAEYDRRKKELTQARRQVDGMPAMLQEVGRHIGDQAKLLKRIKKMDDWVDPRTGLGRGRAIFQKRRNKITALTDKLAAATAQVKAVVDKGSTLDVKVERAGAFAGTVDGVGASGAEFEWIVNGKLVRKGEGFAIGNDRTIRVQVRLVDARRKQSRTIEDGTYARKAVAAVDYDFEYGLDGRTFSHWVVEEELYSDWKVDARTARVPSFKVSTSGAHAVVKGDVITITFSPDTAAERLRVSVIGRTQWAMTGRRGGKPITDSDDGSGSAWVDLGISPNR